MILIFTLVFELARPQKFVNVQTNRHFDKIIIISKNIIFSMFTYKGFFVDQNAMVLLNFFSKNSFSRFWDISKKWSKKTLFSCTITILNHTLYGKVKGESTETFLRWASESRESVREKSTISLAARFWIVYRVRAAPPLCAKCAGHTGARAIGAPDEMPASIIEIIIFTNKL